MENLAGIKDCDRTIERELCIARIPIIDVPQNQGEVKYSKMGVLQNMNCPIVGKTFIFVRACYYWMVSGPVPLSIATKIYNDPAGVKDIRAGGDCSCSPPDQHQKEFDLVTGKEVILDETLAKMIDMKLKVPDKYISKSDLLAAGRGPVIFVTSYHIDSEVGLRVFVDYLHDNFIVCRTV